MVACPTCGKELTFIKEYDRFYCYAEAKYAPKGYGTPPEAAPPSGPAIAPESHDGHYHCPSCGKELSFVTQYGRYYCYPEQKYAPKDIQPVGAPPANSPTAEAAEPAEMPEPAPIVEPAPSETVPLAAIEEPAKEEPKPEAAPAEAAPVEAVPPSEPTPEAPVTEAAAPGGPERPPLLRFAIMKAKKAQLMSWCDAYGLDPIGTRTVLRDRLLQYMDDHRVDAAEEEIPPEAQPTPTAVEPTPAPEVAPSVAPVAVEPTAEEPRPEPVPEAVPEPVAEPVPEPTPEPTPPIVEPAPVEPAPAEAAPAEATALEVPRPAVVEPARVEPTPVEPEPAPLVPEVKVEKPLACPKCGKDLTYIAKYDRLFCYSCGNYAPKEYGKEPAPAPPLAVVEVPKPATVEPPKVEEAPMAAELAGVAAPVVTPPKVEGPKAARPCPTCGAELRFIKDYDRWFCDAERKYAPKDWGRPARNACPTCGKDLTWIPEYRRWFCYAENKYGPKTMAAPTAAVAAAPEVRVEPAVPAAFEARVAALEQALQQTKHAHGRPAIGAVMAGVGFALVVVWFLFLPVLGPLEVLGVFSPITLGLQVLQLLSVLALIGLVVAMAGVVGGLASARRR